MADPITIIGARTKISGNLKGDEDLQVDGRLEGTLSLSKTLTVAPEGIVVADVDVLHLVVGGVLVGNVRATESVQILESGRMVGDITSPRVIIVDGASFRGQVDMGELDVARAEERPAARRESADRPARTAPASAPRPVARPSAAPAPQAASQKAPAPAQRPASAPRPVAVASKPAAATPTAKPAPAPAAPKPASPAPTNGSPREAKSSTSGTASARPAPPPPRPPLSPAKKQKVVLKRKSS